MSQFAHTAEAPTVTFPTAVTVQDRQQHWLVLDATDRLVEVSTLLNRRLTNGDEIPIHPGTSMDVFSTLSGSAIAALV